MWVIPVIDVRQGMVVRGVAGDRSSYRPLQSPWAENASPESVLRGIQHHFAPPRVYVADLDGIVDDQPREEVWRQLAESAVPLLLDAGIADHQTAQLRLELARHCQLLDVSWVVGLESLRSADPTLLERLVRFLGPAHSVFSLDLHSGHLLTHPDAVWPTSPLEVVRRAWTAGFRRLIVLDLANVGCERGVVASDLLSRLRREFPDLELISGGGVRNREDLERLAAQGCDAALVATALHRGDVTRNDLWIEDRAPRKIERLDRQ